MSFEALGQLVERIDMPAVVIDIDDCDRLSLTYGNVDGRHVAGFYGYLTEGVRYQVCIDQ